MTDNEDEKAGKDAKNGRGHSGRGQPGEVELPPSGCGWVPAASSTHPLVLRRGSISVETLLLDIVLIVLGSGDLGGGGRIVPDDTEATVGRLEKDIYII